MIIASNVWSVDLDTFHDAHMKNFLSRFSYGKVKPLINESRKRQKIFLKWNLRKDVWNKIWDCQIHVWFTSLFNCNEQFPKSVRSYCISILKYLNGKSLLYNKHKQYYYLIIIMYEAFFMKFSSFSGIIEDWCDLSTLPQLTKLLKTLFLKTGLV